MVNGLTDEMLKERIKIDESHSALARFIAQKGTLGDIGILQDTIDALNETNKRLAKELAANKESK